MIPFIQKKLAHWTPAFGVEYEEIPISSLPMTFDDTFIVEAGLVENYYAYIIYIPRKGCSYHFPAPESHKISSGDRSVKYPSNDETTACSLATTNEPYSTFSIEFKDHYSKLKTVVERVESEALNMSEARNKSLDKVSSKYVFILDIDLIMTYTNIDYCYKQFGDLKHYGVFSLRQKAKPVYGNGVYFGKTEIIKKNKFDERFKRCFYEDTEYLLNFSRIGIPICNIMVDYTKKPDGKERHTQQDKEWPMNLPLFAKIITKGRNGES